MKILQINSVCGIRSTGRICTDIADILKATGHECMIAYGRESVPEKYKDISVRIGTDTGVKLDGIKTRVFDNAGFNSKAATKKFVEWVREYDPDIIHLHNIHGYYINVKILFDYLKTAGKPVIWTLHDCWSMTGHCAYFDFAGCNKWMTGCSHCPQKKSYPTSILFDRSSKNYNLKKQLFGGVEKLILVPPSEWLADKIGQSYLSDYPVRVINNGIDLDIFKPTEGDFRAKYGLQNKRIVLGVAAVWDRRKGLDDFVRLSELLGDEYKVVVVGITEQQKTELPEKILGITRTNNAVELAEIYSAADVLVNPTYEDNYPTVNLESQACGTPVITYKTGGSPESLSDGCGAVVEKGDIEAVYKAVLGLESLTVSDASNFDKNAKYSEYINLYEEILNEDPFYNKSAVTV